MPTASTSSLHILRGRSIPTTYIIKSFSLTQSRTSRIRPSSPCILGNYTSALLPSSFPIATSNIKSYNTTHSHPFCIVTSLAHRSLARPVPSALLRSILPPSLQTWFSCAYPSYSALTAAHHACEMYAPACRADHPLTNVQGSLIPRRLFSALRF